ncbi:unnamed protein product [Phyllotreta striolata]|uniref:beta-N-acetylhexosaminidase n=1 Tax=Phyllotreta striolata TaxID=444603 RepID=A0A9N9TLT9_PHYSR|nr:unnamed protein product [Phyllotreta striolata]
MAFQISNRKYYVLTGIVILTCLITLTLTVSFIVSKTKDISIENPNHSISSPAKPVWKWQCEKNSCQKRRITDQDNDLAILSLPACRYFCSTSAGIWPIPTGEVSVGDRLIKVNYYSIDVVSNTSDTPINALVQEAIKEFKNDIKSSITSGINPGGLSVVVSLGISDTTTNRLTLDTPEGYSLKISDPGSSSIKVDIQAGTFFGARNGLQTLTQLIIYDNIRNEVQMPNSASITDKPAFAHRGIVLDTSRNFITTSALKRTIKAMGASKLNTFHWHLTDTHSFPYESASLPELHRIGAYDPSKVYTRQDVKDLVEYARVRGVKVVPEFDAPAHVGEGWQDTGYLVCLNAQPWQIYCVEPPCGQFDPTKEGLYDAIEDLYGDMLEQFEPDVFHMGGDEVTFKCWENTTSIVEWMRAKGWGTTDRDFVKLWNHFQSNALERLYKKAGREIPAIMWTSHLTTPEYLVESLPKDKYYIQVWSESDDDQIKQLLDNGYKIILSNSDALYMDCGFGSWVATGNNWCSPYIGWQKVYENNPSKIAGDKVHQVLGAEAALWTEQADSSSVDGRLWPRAAAMAEVLWSNASTGWEAAEHRFLAHRERLVLMGIDADAIEPEWCRQNEENCRTGSRFNV